MVGICPKELVGSGMDINGQDVWHQSLKSLEELCVINIKKCQIKKVPEDRARLV